jgi:hypothetical protein
LFETCIKQLEEQSRVRRIGRERSLFGEDHFGNTRIVVEFENQDIQQPVAVFSSDIDAPVWKSIHNLIGPEKCCGIARRHIHHSPRHRLLGAGSDLDIDPETQDGKKTGGSKLKARLQNFIAGLGQDKINLRGEFKGEVNINDVKNSSVTASDKLLEEAKAFFRSEIVKEVKK